LCCLCCPRGVPVEVNLWLRTKGKLPLEGTYKIERREAGSAGSGAIIKSALVIVIIAVGREKRKGEGLFSMPNFAVCFFVGFFHFGGLH